MNAVNIIIQADDKGAITVLQKTEDAMKRLKLSADQMTGAVPALNGAFRSMVTNLSTLYASFKMFESIRDSTTLAARVETLGIVLQQVGKNTGYSKAEVEAYSAGVQKMGITTQEAHQTIIKMIQAHLDLTKSQELARVAQDAAVIGNINSSEALERLLHGIITLQPEILRTVGITVDFESAYRQFASSVGRTVESLSSQEKQQIALNLVLAQGKDIAGSYEAAMGTVGKLMTSLPRFIEGVKEKFGELFKPALGIIIEGLIEKFKSWGRTLEELKASGDLARWADNIKTAFVVAVGSIENLWSAAKKCVSMINDLKEILISASVAMGSYFIMHTVESGAAVAKFATQIKELTIAVEILTYRALTALLTPLGWVAAAIGALTYVTINHYQELRAAEQEMENFKKSLSSLSADANTQALIDQLEITALEIEAVGGASDATRQKIEMLKQVMSGGAEGSQKDWWKGIVHYMDIGGGKGLPPPADTYNLKKIQDMNKKIQEEIAKLTMTEIEYIHYRAAEYAKEGASKILIAQWTAANIKKLQDEIEQRYMDRMRKLAEEEVKSAREHLIMTARYAQKELEERIAIEDTLNQYKQKMGYITFEDFIKAKYNNAVELLKGKLREIDAERKVLSENEYANADKLRELGHQTYIINEKIMAMKQYEVYELDEMRINKQKELNDLLKNQADYNKKGYDDTWVQLMNMANQVGGEAGAGLGKLGSSIKGIADIGMGQDIASQRYREALKNYNDMKALAEQYYIDDYTQMQFYNQLKLAEEQMYTQQRLSIVSNGFGAMAGMAQAFYALSGNQSKTAFNLYKALAITQTTIDTYQAAVAAYKAMAGIPIVGPALAAAAAAAAIAFGMAKVAAIASLQPGTGASTAAMPSGSGGYAYSTPTTNTWEKTETNKSERPIVINIHVAGNVVDHDAFAREIIPSIKKAVEDGMRE